jgi:hypothetical protein
MPRYYTPAITAKVTKWVAKDLQLFGYAPYSGSLLLPSLSENTEPPEEPARSAGAEAKPSETSAGGSAAGSAASSFKEKGPSEPWWKTHQAKGKIKRLLDVDPVSI